MSYSLLDACFICPVVVDTDADCVGLEGLADAEVGLDMMLVYLMYSFILVYASVRSRAHNLIKGLGPQEARQNKQSQFHVG